MGLDSTEGFSHHVGAIYCMYESVPGCVFLSFAFKSFLVHLHLLCLHDLTLLAENMGMECGLFPI